MSVSAPETMEELQKVSGNANVPVLLVGQRMQRGFDTVIYQELLDAAGFPRTPSAAATGSGAPARQ